MRCLPGDQRAEAQRLDLARGMSFLPLLLQIILRDRQVRQSLAFRNRAASSEDDPPPGETMTVEPLRPDEEEDTSAN